MDWPSLRVASSIFDVSSVFLALSLCVGFVSTVLIVWMGIVKEHHWDHLRDSAHERIVGLEAQTARAQSEIAQANERAAEANAKAETERLQRTRLEAEIAPRSFSAGQLEIIAEQLKPFSGRKVTLGAYSMDLEAVELGRQISEALERAGITIEPATMMFVGGEPIVGIEVYGPNAELAKTLSAALSIEPRITVSNPGSVNRPPVESTAAATVWVGVKPLPKIK